MPLATGTKLGSFEILSLLGSGGMGEVYRARDTKLERDVAIKVLPEEFTRDKERLARFEREAKLLAAVNHTNIATLYGLEESDGIRFLVMELVEGQTLAEQIAQGSVPIDEALPLFKQIAEGLGAAHDKGVIHRDLKPANIKVTAERKPKILDFGLAKPFGSEFTGSASPESPTVTREGTKAGVILGTAAYMSPEQARGKPVDQRTDIWAFGCVLYEALTGRSAFLGDTVADTLSAIVSKEPDWQALPLPRPAGLEALLLRCLRKDPQRRFRDVWDVRVEIEEALAASAEITGIDTGQRPPTRRDRAIFWRMAAAIATLAALAAGLAMWSRTPDPSWGATRRLAVTIPRGETLALEQLGEARPALALSPDGTLLVYVAGADELSRLYQRPLDAFEATPISGTEGASNPVFSPDGDWVAFFAERKLKKVSLRGGEPVTLCEVREALGGTWSSSNDIYYTEGNGRALFRVSAEGGVAEQVFSGDQLFWPDALPGGKQLLISNARRIVAMDTETGETKVVLEEGSFPRYLPTGHLVYSRSEGLMVVAFDPVRLETTGSAVPLPESIRMETFGGAQLATSRDGSMAYIPGRFANEGTFVWVDREGTTKPAGLPSDIYGTFQIAPDGERLAVEVMGATSDIWVFDLGRGMRNRLTFEGSNRYPVWSPDGEWILFSSDRNGARNLFRKRSDGSGEAIQVATSEYTQISYTWSKDGQWVAFTETSPNMFGDIWVLRLEEEGSARPFVQTDFHESLPMFSPDGRWLAYTSSESGREEVYVRPFPESGAPMQISTDGGEEPVWSANGDEIIYRNGRALISTFIQTEPTFTAGAPSVLSEGNYLNVSGRSHDVTSDGARFLRISRTEQSEPREIHLVLNWFEEVKQLARGN